MKQPTQLTLLAGIAGMLVAFCYPSRATVVFNETFNGYTGGNQNALQFGTGLKVSYGGNLPGWNKAGAGVIHAVDLNGTGNYAVMIWQDNVITLANGIEANEAGVEYTVEFAGGPAVYANAGQTTAAEDGLVIDVLRSDDSVLATYTYQPGAWAGVEALTPASFKYAGDGSSPVRLRVGPLLSAGRFAGAIDNLKVTSDVVFADDFNGYTGGNQNATQYKTGLLVSFGGNLPGWNKAGAGAVHAVDLSGTGNYAPMLWQNNVITLASGVAANEARTVYNVSFWGAPAVYADGGQATAASDGMVFDVLRANNSVLATYIYKPGAWANVETFAPGGFEYIGDGSGPVRLRVGPLSASGHFAGAVENVTLSVSGSAMPPTIVTQPAGATVMEGGDVAFSVEATGAPTYQWRKNGTPIPGATNARLALSNLKRTDAGAYSVVVENIAGSVTSAEALLAVTAAPAYTTYRAAVLADNPIHYYPLDETNGTAAADLGSLATVPGTYTGGIILGQPSASARLGTCAFFDGLPGTFVDLGLFHPGNNVTVEAWVNLHPTASHSPSYHDIAGRMDGSYILDFAPGDLVNFAAINDGNVMAKVAGASATSRGAWHHLVGVFSDGTATVYVDGVKGTEQSVGGVLQNLGPTPDRVLIGASRNGSVNSFNFKGSIDDVAFYDYALRPEQIRGHFRASQPGALALQIQRSQTITWPTFPPGYVLQWADRVEGPYESYPGPIYSLGDKYMAPVPLGPTHKSFRLLEP